MEIQFFAIAVLAAGVVGCLVPARYSLWSMLFFSVFWGSSAITLTAIGGSSVSPASLYLSFYFGRLLLLPGAITSLCEEIHPHRPLFWFMLLTIWAVISGIFFPRFFAREMLVYSLTRYSDVPEMELLRPTAGNFSQMVYAVGGFITAWATCSYCRMPGGYRAAFQGILAMAIINLVGAVLDAGTSLTGTSFLMDMVRNGSYAMLSDAEVANVKRLVGWMPEASVFSYFSLQLLAATFTFYVARIRPLLTGTVSILLALTVAASTSTAGYFGLGVFYLAFAVYAIYALGKTQYRPFAIFVSTTLLSLVAALLLITLVPKLGELAERIVTEMVLKKGSSESALERGSWNSTAWDVFLETRGLGAGLGCTRGSSYLLVLLSNLGVVGFTLYAMMFWRTMSLKFPETSSPRERSVIWAARMAVSMTLVVGMAIWNVYDLGASYYCLLGLCMSVDPQRSVIPSLAASPVFIAQNSRPINTRKPVEAV